MRAKTQSGERIEMREIHQESLVIGESLSLRKDVLPQAKVREWLFVKIEGERIFLEHKTMGYVWDTSVDDIDWEDYERKKKGG